jgi:methylmalonyl-CoA mutase
MLPEQFTIADDFPAITYDQWRTAAKAELKGDTIEQKLVTHTYDGVDIQPIYTRHDELKAKEAIGMPGAPPFVRGSNPAGARNGWDLRPEHAHPDLRATNCAILQDLEGGATSISLRFDSAARAGLDPDSPAAANLIAEDGVAAYCTKDLEAVFSGVQLPLIGVAFEPGAAFLPAAAILVALWRHGGIQSNEVRGAFNADPLGVLAAEGNLPVSTATAFNLLSELAAWTSKNFPHVTAVGVDTSVYHLAGATAVQDIGFAVATGVEYLRSMTAAGLGVDEAARQITFTFSLGTHHFLAIAKLRAARWLWSRVIEAAGGSPAAGAMCIHAKTSSRVLTQRDVYVNLLRNTVAVFSAGIAGADSIASVPFDALLGEPDEFSRRIARNTPLILQEESNLNRVIDPAGGSWFLDRLTQQIAQQGWNIFQQVERRGGMQRVLTSGWIAAQIEAAFAPRAKNIAHRMEGITGISEFPDVAESAGTRNSIDYEAIRAAAITRTVMARKPVNSLETLTAGGNLMEFAIAAAIQGATIGQLAHGLKFGQEMTEIQPLPTQYFARPFEQLRAASDAWLDRHGKRPMVFLANMGPLAHHAARATYAKNFFEAGGFAVISNNGFEDTTAAVKAFSESKASVAVICSSDKLYPDVVPTTAAALKAAGAHSVVLAGNPGAHEEVWRTAGVDRFIFMKCDVLATLREMLQEEGVLGAAVTAVQN